MANLISEVKALIIRNIPAIALLIMVVIVYSILARSMFGIPIGIGTSLSILLFLVLVSAALVILSRVYVRERIMSCRRANEFVSGVTALMFIISFIAISYQSIYAVVAALLFGATLAVGLYMLVLVDIDVCKRSISVKLTVLEPSINFDRVIVIRDKVTVGGSEDYDVVIPIEGIQLTLYNNEGILDVSGKGLMVEGEGGPRPIESLTMHVNESYIILMGNARIRLTRLS